MSTHQVVAFYTSDNSSFSNSDSSAQPLSLTVSPAPLTITPTTGQSKVYGTAVPTLTYTSSGFVNNDPTAPLTGALGTLATASSPVGSTPSRSAPSPPVRTTRWTRRQCDDLRCHPAADRQRRRLRRFQRERCPGRRRYGSWRRHGLPRPEPRRHARPRRPHGRHRQRRCLDAYQCCGRLGGRSGSPPTTSR